MAPNNYGTVIYRNTLINRLAERSDDSTFGELLCSISLQQDQLISSLAFLWLLVEKNGYERYGVSIGERKKKTRLSRGRGVYAAAASSYDVEAITCASVFEYPAKKYCNQ